MSEAQHEQKKPLVSIVAPFFNEEAGVGEFFRAIKAVAASVPHCRFEVICVDDGSKDNTLEKLKEPHGIDTVVVELSRNFGKEAALTAGLDVAAGDAVIPIDSDLQDPPELIPRMIELWAQGYDVVLAKRADRSVDSASKRISAVMFYKLYNKIANLRIPENVGDYRLMTRQVVEAVKRLPEQQRFMKGLFAWAGFRQTTIEFHRQCRNTGSTSWNKWRLWNFALEGLTSFSTLPLRVWTYVGSLVAAFSLLYGIALVFRVLVHGIDVPGYASTIVAILFLGGMQLIGIGVLGEYLGRTYMESKRRPVYLIRTLERFDSA
ncbi:putative glycosyltransferase [Ralstonia mannitolilytica]|nr:putative glycosyltransferase [Ralstonia mannitolilytica]